MPSAFDSGPFASNSHSSLSGAAVTISAGGFSHAHAASAGGSTAESKSDDEYEDDEGGEGHNLGQEQSTSADQLAVSMLVQIFNAVPHARTSILKAMSLRLDLAAVAYNSSAGSGASGSSSSSTPIADLNLRVAAGAACIEVLARLCTKDRGIMVPLAADLQEVFGCLHQLPYVNI